MNQTNTILPSTMPGISPLATALDAPLGGHTPGPWTCELGRIVPAAPVFGFRITGGSDKWHSIAGCAVYEPHNADCFTPAEMEANGRLLAAAPDLLDACRAAHFAIEKMARTIIAPRDNAVRRLANKLAAVIAKAEGTPPPPVPDLARPR